MEEVAEAHKDNGSSCTPTPTTVDATDDEPIVGPGPAPRSRRKRPLQFEKACLDSLPSANMYEKSYMHLDVVIHVAVSAAEFFITGSADAFQVSVDGMLCCTISSDQSVKVYDVVNYDMMAMVRLLFIPGCAKCVYKQRDVKAKLDISYCNSSFVHIYDARAGTNEPIISREIHFGPVRVMKFNHVFDTVISADDKGIIEYWNPATLKFPEDGVSFQLKSDTNLFEIVKCKTAVSTVENWQTIFYNHCCHSIVGQQTYSFWQSCKRNGRCTGYRESED